MRKTCIPKGCYKIGWVVRAGGREACEGTGTTHLGKPCTASSECCKGCCVAPFKPNNPNRAFVCANAVNATVGVCLPN